MLGRGDLQSRAVPSAQAYAYPLLIKQILAAAVRQSPDQEIVYRDRIRFDYRQLAQRVARLGRCLDALGVGPGAAVGILDWDSHRYLEAYFAVPSLGAALHTVNTKFTPEQIIYTINQAQDSVLLVHAQFLKLLEAIRDRLGSVRHIVVLTEDGKLPLSPIDTCGEYEALLEQAAPDFDFPDFDENTVATLFHTTGTTGLPKGVFFSHRQIFLHTLSVGLAFGASPAQGRLHRGDVYMPITPMFHVHAWGIPYVAAMLGIKQVFPGRYEPEMLVRLIREEGVTFSHCVPTLVHMLLRAAEGSDLDLSGLKLAIAGSALAPGLARAARARGIDIFLGYGMSETCPVLTLGLVDPERACAQDPDQIGLRTSAGRPLALVEIRFEPQPGQAVQAGSAGQFGEITVRAPWLTQGYLDDPAASDDLWRGGYLHTGDIGFMGKDGYLRITDRAKDVIKCGGEWISSIEIEAAISNLPAVREVAVIPVDDPRWGERPCALVVQEQGGDEPLLERRIPAHLRDLTERGELPRNAILTRIRMVDQLPRTSIGKFDKRRMREALS